MQRLEGVFRSFVATRGAPEIIAASTQRARHVEIEISLGVLRGRDFFPCVRPTDELAVREKFASGHGSLAADYWYDNPVDLLMQYNALCSEAARPGARLRIQTDGTGHVVRCEIKCRVAIDDYASTDSHYDVRARVCIEIGLPAMTSALEGQPPPPGWSVCRDKVRTPLQCPGAQMWNICTTLVTTRRPDDPDDFDLERTREIEAEIDMSARPDAGPRETADWLADAAGRLWQHFVMPHCVVRGARRELGPSGGSLLLGDLTEPQSFVCDRLSAVITRAYGRPNGSDEPFRGQLPRALSRAEFDRLLGYPQLSDTLVSLKVDGERVFLIVTRDGAFLHTRAGRSFSIGSRWPTQERAIVDALTGERKETTILDCELVDIADGRHVLVVFDVVMLCAKPCAAAMLMHERVQELRVLEPTLVKLSDALGAVPFAIGVKQFAPLDQYQALWETIERGQDGRCVRVNGALVPVDGLVFIDTVRNFAFKWKPAAKMSVDLLATPMRERRIYSLAMGADDGGSVNTGSIELSTEDAWRLEMAQLDTELLRRAGVARLRPVIIFECVLDTYTTEWRLVRIRTDKTRPNHASVAMHTLAVQGSGLTHRFIATSILRVAATAAP